MIRSLAERFARGMSCRRKLPAGLGNRCIYLSPDSALQYFSRKWAVASRPLLTAAEKYVQKGDNVWDIGGNCGVFTFASAHIAGPASEIVSIEADPFLASLLQKSARHPDNTDRNIHIVCAAASNHIGLERFLIANRGRSSNSLERAGQRSQAGGIRYRQHVPTVTLDSLLAIFTPPQILKIDVEGAEALVLEGANRILSESRPTIYIEVGGEQNEAVTAILKTYGYRLFNGDLDDEKELRACSWNTLAVPEESIITNRGHRAGEFAQ